MRREGSMLEWCPKHFDIVMATREAMFVPTESSPPKRKTSLRLMADVDTGGKL